jgi:hypothetical protein
MSFLVQSLELNITVSAEESESDEPYRGIKYTLETWGQMYLFYKFTLDGFYTFCNFKKKETEIDIYWQNNLSLLLAKCEDLIS